MDGNTLNYLMFSVGIGCWLASAIVAVKRGGQAWMGFAFCILCSPIGLVLTCVLPGAENRVENHERFKQLSERRREWKRQREAKRLADELRLERQQNQQLRYAMMSKLAQPAIPPSSSVLHSESNPESDSPPPLPAESSQLELWHVVVDSNKLGPLNLEMLVDLAKNKRLGPATLVWRKGYAGWTTLESEKALMALLPNMFN